MSPSGIHPCETLPYVWLVAFALAATMALFGAACQVLRQGQVKWVSWALWTTLSGLLAALCFTALCERLDGWLPDFLALIAKSSLIALLAVGCYALVALRRGKSKVAPRGPRLSWGLIAANALAAVWASGSFYEGVAPVESPLPLLGQAPIEWVRIENAKAYTDRGNPVDLRRLESPTGTGPSSSDIADAFPHRVIQVAACDDRANCHGWVFTGGRFAISGDDVDTILRENQYDPVERPKAGDLIVYRGDRGEIVHSGIVRTAQEALILVESKWGALARYLHQPRDQAYSSNYKFYHSPRDGHLIQWEGEAAVDSDHALDVKPSARPRHDYVVVKSAAFAEIKLPFGRPTLGRPQNPLLGRGPLPSWCGPCIVPSRDAPLVGRHDQRHRS